MLDPFPRIIRILYVFQGFLISNFLFLLSNIAVSAAESNDIRDSKLNTSCPIFIPLTNTVKPTLNFNKAHEIENKTQPNSSCALDLLGVTDEVESINQNNESLLNAQKTSSEDLFTFENYEITNINDIHSSDRWHFKLQPYATIPVNTYGTVSARGKTVSYHLSLGELLDTLRVAASGRFEGWKGRWGFIIDGYFASLQGIGNLSIERSREPNPINTLNFLLNTNVNNRLENIINRLNQDRQIVTNIQEIRDKQPLRQLDQNLQNIETIFSEKEQNFQELDFKLQQFEEQLITGRQTLEILDIKLEDVRNLGLEFDQLPRFDPNTQPLSRIISLQIQDLPIIDDLQTLNNQIKELNQLSDLGQLQEKLIQTRDNLDQLNQQIKTLQETNNSQALQNLENQLEETKIFLDQQIGSISKIKEFQEFQANQQTQTLNIDNQTSLQFDQGIYDFAISYHFGELPFHQLPDKPSNRPYPLLWFQPIAGVRLNDISIDIEAITTTKISSTLVNFEATTKQNFKKDRTWLEPLLGGKLGLQISDPITFWLRGDASGFGLAGDTDISWNLLFGIDWWIHQQISLQLGYRFYEIDYKNTRDNNDFGFEENFNGLFLSASFHF
ncbi:hypothetical protein [Crocosphaera chwakensis]|uniref:Uncharacterized protein n=1 Tax=Crocosphaera chwakensis CCY0110 TaxID=391612 RepID=A3INY8_9CHRO|nr:hypothetical protein [Crocosphaera chwakensis]EAZ91790.1 hypothetical protein CY0110_07514 [Crocosphaera chwakensis CCY0110]